MKRILITGAGGFVGRNLGEYLKDKEQYEVFAVKRTDLDLLDECAVKQYIHEHQITLIIHCANIGGSRKTNYDMSATDVVEKNLRMFFNLQRCLTPAMRMIHFGSGAEYDRRNYKPKMAEDDFDAYVPADAYGYSKYVMSKCIENRDNIICFRIFGLFGKYEDYLFKFISNAIVKNLLQMPIIINQNVIFDYLYINDFCQIIEHFIENKPLYKHYNITPTKSIELLQIANIINEMSDYQSEIKVLHTGMNKEYSGCNERICKELGGFSFMDYRQSIEELYLYYKSNLDLLNVQGVQQDSYLAVCLKK